MTKYLLEYYKIHLLIPKEPYKLEILTLFKPFFLHFMWLTTEKPYHGNNVLSQAIIGFANLNWFNCMKGVSPTTICRPYWRGSQYQSRVQIQKRNLKNFGAENLCWKFRVLGVVGLDSNSNETRFFSEKLAWEQIKVLFW